MVLIVYSHKNLLPGFLQGICGVGGAPGVPHGLYRLLDPRSVIKGIQFKLYDRAVAECDERHIALVGFHVNQVDQARHKRLHLLKVVRAHTARGIQYEHNVRILLTF